MKTRRKLRQKFNWFNARLRFILVFFFCALFGLLGRIYYLKSVHGEEYETRAKTQQVNRYDAVLPANRGAILDRNNQPLALSTAMYHVVLDARVLSQATAKEQERVLQTLKDSFSDQIDIDKIKNFIAINPETKRPNLDTSWRYLVKWVDRETKEKLEAEKLSGIVYEQDSKRSYPLKNQASQLLGFIRGDTAWGLESQYYDEMTGVPGRSFITYDGDRTAIRQDYPGQDGNTLVTTIDYTIQQYAQQVVDKTNAQWPSENVAALVMNPNTGEIYAMADSNSVDLNEPSQPLALSDTAFREQWEQMDDKAQLSYLNRLWRNFHVTSTFEPGSIFKPLVAAAALEENVISTNSTFYCSGIKKMYGHDIRCHLRTGHGTQTVEEVLANSCNIGLMEMADKMGKDTFYRYQKDFGFGETTGIDLPGEVSAANLMYTPDRIGPVELATMSFGQSFNTTTIQMLTAFSAVINGGNLMHPYVVSQVLDQNHNIVKETQPEVVRKVISRETSDIVRTYLQATVEWGTGKKAKIAGYHIGGKTGTAEQGDRKQNEWVLSFITYFPVENPEYIVMVVINRPENYVNGVQTPSPMMKELVTNIIQYKKMKPAEEVEPTTETIGNDKVIMEDYTGASLNDALTKLQRGGFPYRIAGTGNTITNQVPHGGTDVVKGHEVILYVTRGEGEDGYVAIPNVIGKTFEEAITQLNDAGFDAVAADEQTEGKVTQQAPLYGIFAEKGSSVTLTLTKEEVSQEPEENT